MFSVFNKNSWVPNTGGMELEVLSIERVRNKMLEQRFLAKKQQYEQKYGQVRIVKGWHGTKQDNVDPILRNNFDVSKHGQNKGNKQADPPDNYKTHNPTTKLIQLHNH